MDINDGLVVTIEYTLRDSNGKVLESSDSMGAVTFKMGDKRMLPGLVNVIRDMKVGETRTGTIDPGQLVPREMTTKRHVPLNEFPADLDPKVSDRFQAKDHDGKPVLFEVFERTDDAVGVHLLHVLHDVEVHYEVRVIAGRKSNLPPPPPIDVPDLTDEILEDG